MSILAVIVAIALVGVVLWLVNTYVPMDPVVKRILNIAVIVLLILWLLRASGLLDSLAGIRV